MDIMWPVVVVGIVAIIIGVLVILNRQKLASSIAQGQRATFGRVGEKVASQSKPAGVLIPGVGAIAIGAIMIFVAVVFPESI